jgi:hypothetical protein
MFSTCEYQYKLKYIDKLSISSGNINTIFGSSLHFTLQEYLKKVFNVSKVKADQMDLDSILMEEMKKNFTIEREKLGSDVLPATKLEMEEYFGDGINIIEWFKKNLKKFYSKTRHELIGIELPLELEIRSGVNFTGFIDVILKDKIDDKIIIIDLKTSKNGWSKWQKDDPIKKSQLLLYKKFYSDIFNVPMDKITVKYQILKRKLYENVQFPIPRISDFCPPNGKPSVNNAHSSFLQFINSVFAENGEYIDRVYNKNVGKHCQWCEFYKKYCDGIK